MLFESSAKLLDAGLITFITYNEPSAVDLWFENDVIVWNHLVCYYKWIKVRADGSEKRIPASLAHR